MAYSIRFATERDAPGILGIYRPIVESTPISFETRVSDEDEMARRVAKTLSECVETSVYVHSDHRRQGVGQALYFSLLGILTAQGYFNAYAGVTLPNSASVALHESLGFEPIGVYRRVGYKLGQWHDVGWWQLALHPPDTVPGPTLGVSQIDRDRLNGLLTDRLTSIRPRPL